MWCRAFPGNKTHKVQAPIATDPVYSLLLQPHRGFLAVNKPNRTALGSEWLERN
jgi:hypothetical protein